MAKTIKTIKCPTCGSTKITETRQDYYKCYSCDVDFILDNDDININHRHITNTTANTINYNDIKKMDNYSLWRNICLRFNNQFANTFKKNHQ